MPVASGNHTDVLSGGGPDGNRFSDAARMFDEGELDTASRTTTVTQSHARVFLLPFLVNGSILLWSCCRLPALMHTQARTQRPS